MNLDKHMENSTKDAQLRHLHLGIWKTLDYIAQNRGLSPSGFAKLSGLDPTAFNMSKRFGADGRPRWPSTETLARALQAAEMTISDFAAIMTAHCAK